VRASRKELRVRLTVGEYPIVDFTVDPIIPEPQFRPTLTDHDLLGRDQRGKIIECDNQGSFPRRTIHLGGSQNHRLVEVRVKIDKGYGAGIGRLDIPRRA